MTMPQHELGEKLVKTPVVVIDIDGVVFDTPGQAVTRWNEIHGTDYQVPDIFDHNAVHDKEKFRDYHDQGQDEDERGRFDDGFYDAQRDVDNYTLITGVAEVLQRLKEEYGARIVALTARNPRNLGTETRQALETHLGLGDAGHQLVNELLFSGDPDHGQHREKGEILRELDAAILIEDSIKNAENAEKFGRAALVLTQPHNANGHHWPPEKRGQDWEELYRMIQNELERQGYRKIGGG
jgi:beta-phosphoglucomutase-like phosphatase (HAD superfamily)